VILLWAALSMAAKDCFGTLMVIAEARGRALTAGALDAAGDIAVVLTTLFGAGQVIEHGWDTRSFEVIAVIAATSFLGTALWTRLGTRLMPSVPSPSSTTPEDR
jgi:hypothetical protein